MPTSMDEIISQISAYIADPESETDVVQVTYPPTTAEKIEAVEKELGFELPPLLKRLYTEVGNGGFGPAYGFAGVDGCGTDEGHHDIVTLYQWHQSEEGKRHFPNWPQRMLKAVCLGCGMYAAIDCSTSDYNVLLYDPNLEDVDGGNEDEEKYLTNCLFPYRISLNKWLYAWAKGEDVELPVEFREPEEDEEEDE